MELGATLPPFWEHRIETVALRREFATAMAALGWSPIYAHDETDAALVLIRRLPLPGIRSWTMRARVYVHRGMPAFIHGLQQRLTKEGVAFAVIGDALHPIPQAVAEGIDGAAVVRHHRIVHDVTRSDDAIVADMARRIRSSIRRASAAGVQVSVAETDEDLKAFCALNRQTADRIRSRHLVAALPDAFLRTVFQTVVPAHHAIALLARIGDVPLAGALMYRNGPYFRYAHGVSTRDRDLTPLQGPTVLIWRAMQLARELGFGYFDHGAVTVTDDPAHPHFSVYDYKRAFGGRIETSTSAQLVLSATRHAFQERVLLPLWKRFHPLYLRFARLSEVSVAASSMGLVVLA